MARILFVEQKLHADKLGLLYIAAVLWESEHNVYLVQDEIDSAEAMIHSWRPDFVAYSITSAEYRWFTSMNKKLKKRCKFTCVVGGPHFTFFPEQGVSDPDVDFVVQGPGEYAMLDIVEGRTSEKLVIGHIPEDVNTIPPPDRSILYRYPEFGDARMKRFIAGRDCPNSCIYCFNHLYHRLYASERRRFFQITSPRRMVDEIAEVRRRWKLEYVYFNDDDLARDHGWLKEFLPMYAKEIGLPFCGMVRAENATTEILRKMAEAGCSFLNFALESAVPETLKMLRRGRVTREDIIRCAEDCKNWGIHVRILNMIGLPVDNPMEDALETLKFNMEIASVDSAASIFQPYMGTDAWKLCLKKGLIKSNAESMPFFNKCILNIPDAERIERLAQWWFFIVKHSLPMELVDILLELPLTTKQMEKILELRYKTCGRLLYGI